MPSVLDTPEALLQYLQNARLSGCIWGEVDEFVRPNFTATTVRDLIAAQGFSTDGASFYAALEPLYAAIGEEGAKPRPASRASFAVHDLSNLSSSEAYARTQYDEAIKDGDILDLGNGNVGILVEAWPAVVTGVIASYHRLAEDYSWDQLDNGKYAAAAARAREIASAAISARQQTPEGKRIVAVFQPQAWVDDNAVDIDGREDVDVTEAVLKMDLTRIQGLQDCRDSSDELVNDSPVALEHDGPFSVHVVNSVCAYFGVGDVREITHEQLQQARSGTAMGQFEGADMPAPGM